MKRFLLGLAGLLALIAGVFTGLAHTPQSPRELVFLNGQIRTMSGAGIVEAMLVRDGRIVALGSRDEVLAQAPWLTARVDLDGGTLTPGLIEPHTHPLASALLSTAIDISGTRYETRDAIMAAIADGVAHPAPSPWTIAFGWDPVMLDGLTPPDLEELDALSPERPLVILTQMMHEAFANSAALQAAGITAETPDPQDGYFERDANGDLTGRLVEVHAVRALMDAIPGASDAALTYLLSAEYDRYARAGYTTIGVASLVGRADDPLGVLHAVASGDTPSLNTVLYTAPEDAERGRTLFQNVDPGPGDPPLCRHQDVGGWLALHRRGRRRQSPMKTRISTGLSCIWRAAGWRPYPCRRTRSAPSPWRPISAASRSPSMPRANARYKWHWTPSPRPGPRRPARPRCTGWNTSP